MRLLPILAACTLLLASCGKAEKAQEAQKDPQTVEESTDNRPVVDIYSPDGTVHELDNVTAYAPGCKVSNLTVLDFNAVWCGPCRQLAPVLEEMARQYEGRVTFISVDVDTYGSLFEAYNLGNSIPAVVFIKPDGNVSSFIGTGDLLPASKFEALINARLNN